MPLYYKFEPDSYRVENPNSEIINRHPVHQTNTSQHFL